MPTIDAYPKMLFALCLYREARGQSKLAKIGIRNVIRNRMRAPKAPYADCDSIEKVILAPFQFSSFNRADPNSNIFPNPRNKADWTAWEECCAVADEEDEFDPTHGSTHYHSFDLNEREKWPSWAQDQFCKAHIGAFRFYRV